jgi:Sugar (and other) transporter
MNIDSITCSILTELFIVGILYAYSIGPFVSYFTFQVFCLVIPVIFIAVFIFMPDSPHYHIIKKNHIKAKSALIYLRSYSHDITSELDQIENDVVESMTHPSGFLNVFKSRANLIGKCTLLIHLEIDKNFF